MTIDSEKSNDPPRVRFRLNDRFGLWERGDEGVDLAGTRQDGSPIRWIRILRTNEIVTLSDPYEDDMIERIA